ncbi:MAG: hypothetical protein JWM59_3057 [Verrucomicrobiales bacterium]|nr:hypothetical protein [Verrucomicrobiales bacterium]
MKKQKKTPTDKTPSPHPTPSTPSNAEIAARAYSIYERSGYAEGNDESNWLEAEAGLIGESMPYASLERARMIL